MASPRIMRRFHRNYKPELVNKELIYSLVNKANSAPVMGPREERLFTVVSDKDEIQGLRLEIMKMIKKYVSLFNIFRKVFFFYPQKKNEYENLYRLFSMQYKENKTKDKLFKDAPHLLLLSAPKTNSGGKDNCMYAMNSFEKYSDNELIDKSLSGDAMALEEIINRYKDLVFNFTLRMIGDYENALEITEDAIPSVIRKYCGYNA